MLHLLLFRMLQKSMPALAGIRVMLRQLFIYCYYQLRSLKVAKPVLNEH